MRFMRLPAVAAVVALATLAGCNKNAAPKELTADPTILKGQFDPAAVTLHGVKIGDRAAAIPAALIPPPKPGEPRPTTFIELTDGNSCRIEGGKVRSLVIGDPKLISRLGLSFRSDV